MIKFLDSWCARCVCHHSWTDECNADIQYGGNFSFSRSRNLRSLETKCKYGDARPDLFLHWWFDASTMATPDLERDSNHWKMWHLTSSVGDWGTWCPLVLPQMDGPGSLTHDAAVHFLRRMQSPCSESDGLGLFQAPTAAKPCGFIRWHLHLPVQFQ